VERLAIAGAGLMGHTIALSAAWAGFETKVWGVGEDDVRKAEAGVAEKLERLARHGVLTAEEAEEARRRVRFTTELEEAVGGATFVIEAVPERLDLKQSFYRRLERICEPTTVLASNTSGLLPTAIAAEMERPERMIVVHFWNPAHLIPLVEVCKGERTSQQTADRAMRLLTDMKKKPIEMRKEVLGFIGNRLQYALFREAQYMLEEGVASAEDIDAAVVYSLGRRLPATGPFMTADLGGLDVFHSISEYLFQDLSKADGSLSRMRSLYENGDYGTKTGKGFYEWDEEKAREVGERRESLLIRFLAEDLGKA